MTTRSPRRGLGSDLASLRIERGADPTTAVGRRRTALWLAALAVTTMLGAGGAVLLSMRDPVVPVVQAVRRVAVGEPRPSELLTGSGYVVPADKYISIGVRVAGRIRAYHVDEGDRVSAGEVLVELDDRPFRVRLDRARAELAEARANIELRETEIRRLRQLRAAEVASDAELDLKENQLTVARASAQRIEADMAQIRLDLEDTVLTAPTDALVVEKLKEAGEMATPGGFAGSGDLVRLASVRELRAEIDVSESDLSKVTLGAEASVVPDALPSRTYQATVVELAPWLNRQKGTLRVELRILEPDAYLRPEMSVRVTFYSNPPDLGSAPVASAAGVEIPASAVWTTQAGSYVWLVQEGRLLKRPVQLGPRDDSRVSVRSGLQGGEAVVADPGVLDLKEGQGVRARPIGER